MNHPGYVRPAYLYGGCNNQVQHFLPTGDTSHDVFDIILFLGLNVTDLPQDLDEVGLTAGNPKQTAQPQTREMSGMCTIPVAV